MGVAASSHGAAMVSLLLLTSVGCGDDHAVTPAERCPAGLQRCLRVTQELAAPGGPLDVAVADFDGDGRLDLATVLPTTLQVAVYPGRGDGVFDEGAKGGVEQVMQGQDRIKLESAEQWMRTVDTRMADFLTQRFALEASREP